jgi:hypothetical protein
MQALQADQLARGVLVTLFDGLLTVFSECRDCGQLMTVVDEMEHVHPCCTEKPTKIESLLQGWLSCVMNGDDESAELTQEEIDVLIGRSAPRLARAAHRYAGFGWPVFPLWPTGHKIIDRRTGEVTIATGKTPATKHGFKDAHHDITRIDCWWGRNPTHNIGLATGHRFDVIDVDPRHGGVPSFLELLRNKALPICHGVAVTASGGMHLYVPRTGKGNFANLRPGIDYRGKGGYVVAPPSTLGQRGYTWLTEPSPTIKGDK